MRGVTPECLEVERTILGAILIDNSFLEVAEEEGLQADDFSDIRHQLIFTAMRSIRDAEVGCRDVDLVALVRSLALLGKLEASGDVDYVRTLVDGVPDLEHAATYILALTL